MIEKNKRKEKYMKFLFINNRLVNKININIKKKGEKQQFYNKGQQNDNKLNE